MSDITTLMMAAAGGQEETDPNFNQTVLLLHGDGTNGAQNNTFLDSSTNNFTITRNGNTTQGTFSPFSNADGEWSNYFDGSGDHFATITDAAFAAGTGDFEISFWLNTLGPVDIYNDRIMRTANNNTAGSIAIFLGAGTNYVIVKIGSSDVITGTVNVGDNEWHYVSISRSGSSLKLFVDGVEDGSATNSTDLTTTALQIGQDSSLGADYDYLGYLSNFRFVVGSANRTSAYTVPTTPDTAITNTQILTCQSNRFVDNSSNGFAMTAEGDLKVTPFSPFAPSAAYSASVNGGSGYFDGSGDYLSIADAAGLRFGTGNFTIQCWIYRNAAGAVHSIAAKGGASTGWVFQVHSDNKLRFTHTTTNIDSTGTIPASAWTHVAVVREGTGTNQVKLYINGVNDGQGTVSTDFNQTEQLNIGADRGNSNVMNGYIAGWKYVVGTAETITVPTAPPTGGTALLNFTNAGILDNTGKNNLETVGNAQIDTTTKKYGTGSMEFDGTGDYLTIPASQDFAFGTGDFTFECWINTSNVPSGSADRIIRIGANAVTGNFQVLVISSEVIRVESGVSNLITGSVDVVDGAWHHIAVTRNGTDLKLFVDGTQDGSTATNSTNFNQTIAQIGYDSTVAGSEYTGFIDDLRITKGIARYTTTFTPPTAAFPNL